MSPKKSKKPEIIFGDVTLSDDELEITKAKIRVTLMLDLKLVRAFKAKASGQGVKWQTLMSKVLRESLERVETDDVVRRAPRLKKRSTIKKKKAPVR